MCPAPKSDSPLPRYQQHWPRKGAGNNERTPIPQAAPHTKLSSTGSAASNFQSFPYPSHSSPRKGTQSNKQSAGWVVTLAKYPIKRRHRPRSAPLLAGNCSSHSVISLRVPTSQYSDYQNSVEEHQQGEYEPGKNVLLIFSLLSFVTSFKN